MKILNVQFAYFFKSFSTSISADKLSVDLRQKVNIFTNPPLIIPLPSDAPEDIPYLRLEGNSGGSLTISKLRADFFFTLDVNVTTFLEFSVKYKQYLDILFNYFLTGNGIKRLGYIVTYFEDNKTPVSFLQNLYLKKEFSDINELSLRVNQKVIHSNLVLNNISKIDPGELSNTKSVGLIIAKDINTDPNSGYDFNYNLYLDFVKAAETYFEFEEVKKLVS